MGNILSVYSENAFREFILPAVDNTDYTLFLGRSYFGIADNISMEMEVLEGKWYIRRSDDYDVQGPEEEQGRYRILSGQIISVTSRQNDEFRMIVRTVQSVCHSFTKLDISDRDRITIGRAADNDIKYESFALVSKYHAVMIRGEGGWSIKNESKNGIYVDSKRILECQKVGYGSFINILGLHIICLGDVLAVDESRTGVIVSPSLKRLSRDHFDAMENEDQSTPADHTTPAKSCRCSRPSERPDTGTFDKEIRVDDSPVTIEQPVIGVSGWKELYSRYLDKIRLKLESLSNSNRKAMLSRYPSSIDIMSGNTDAELLWGRSKADDDLLAVRVGTGDIKSPNEVIFDAGKMYLTDQKLYDRASEIVEKFKVLSDVPFIYDLNGVNQLHLYGKSREEVLEKADNMCVQLAFHVSPSDLKMAFISDDGPDGETARNEARWLPHTWSEDMSCRYYARDKAGTAETVYRLSKVLVSREELSDKEISELTRYVVFVSDVNDIARTILGRYMKGSRYLGFTIVCLNRGSEEPEGYKPDPFDMDMFSRYVRTLAAAENDSSEGVAVIPDFVTLFDTLGISSAADLDIKDRWAKGRTYDHLTGILGMGVGNMPRTLDLHERYHGPHALVAGTTGSGKSELLQSYIISLAAGYSPEDLNFILIDFKGGGMSNTLKGLPHIVGIITNLSGGEAERAILAVKNEIVRRQSTLNDYGINHIDDYVRLYKSGEVQEAMPHLIIAVDEFAEMKKEKPGLMKDLISVAQTGRSLGIHLVLATQRPRGNVDDDIRSNMRSVICLRVQDRKDSMDVLDRPDAAYITGAGRAYLEVGAGEIFDPFQTAFSGKSRISTGKKTGSVLMLTDDGRADVVSSFEDREKTESVSQLETLKLEIIRTADKIGARARDLWLPPLERQIYTDDILAMSAEDSTTDGYSVSYTVGMIDDPENRSQYPLSLSFPDSGNIAIVGTPLSGKTTAVKTLLDQIAISDSPQKPEVYGIDLDSGMMNEYIGSEFIKLAVTGQDVLGIEKLLSEIGGLTESRRVSGGHFRPCIVIIDSYEDFRNIAGYKYEARLAELLREGPGVGITYVMTGGGFGLGQISGGAEKNIKTVLSLQQRSRYDYMDTLHTSGIECIPEDDIKGRGLTVLHGRVLEFQIAVTR